MNNIMASMLNACVISWPTIRPMKADGATALHVTNLAAMTVLQLKRKLATVPHLHRAAPMIARPPLNKTHHEVSEPIALRQTRRKEERFVLKIDGQTKNSFADKDSAMKVGREIKSKYPVVRAVVYDSQEGSNESC